MNMLEIAISTRSNQSGLIRRLHSLYLHANGIPSRAYDTLSIGGFCMSRVWCYTAMEKLSEQQMKKFAGEFIKKNIVCSYDNVNLHHAVYEQRLLTQTDRGHSDGSVGLGIVIEDPNIPFPLPRERLFEHQEHGRGTPITALEILKLEVENSKVLTDFEEDFILECLLESPEFSGSKYAFSDSPALAPPSPVHQLPTGPGFATKYYLFKAEQINEASIDGNDELIHAFFDQLKLNNKEGRLHIGNRVIPFAFDQLSVS